MTMIKRCDGCRRELSNRDDQVTVDRYDPSGGIMHIPDLPDDGHPLHWCRDCAVFAIKALAGRGAR